MKKQDNWMGQIYVVMQFGLTIALCIVFCFFIGRYLDGLFGTKGIFITIFTILGVIGGANVAYRQIMEVLEGEKNENEPDDDKPDN